MTGEANGSPTLGELGRRIDGLGHDLNNLGSKVERYASIAVEAQLGEIQRRLRDLEDTLRAGSTQRSSATWQALFLVLGILGTAAISVVLALTFGRGK